MMNKRYTVLVEREDDGGFSVFVPDLRGCASQGETRDEALANIREAITCHLEGLKADHLPVPEPHTEITAVEVA